jgi:translation initiation factor IF-2
MRHKKPHHKKNKAPIKQHRADALVKKLELVIKGDTAGCVDAVCEMLTEAAPQGFKLEIILQGVGAVCQNDVSIAETGSRLVIGFNVGVLPHIEELCKLRSVEVRLYDVIYTIEEDIEHIIAGFTPTEVKEESLGIAKVIALFKSSRGGIILGCEVMKGRLHTGDNFKVISAMGPVYTGKIQSLHIEKNSIQKAIPAQQVGLKILDFNKAKIGDIVESYRLTELSHETPWTPRGGILYR